MADGPSRARCDDTPSAPCPELVMAVLAAPWVRPGEGRFSSLLRPRFKSHRDHPKHPPRPGRPRCAVWCVACPSAQVARSCRRGERELAARAKWETEQEQQKRARSEALESTRRSHPHAARALDARSRQVHCHVRGPGRPLRCRLAASFRPSLHAHCSLAPPRTGEGSHHERRTRTRTRREARRTDTPRATTRVT